MTKKTHRLIINLILLLVTLILVVLIVFEFGSLMSIKQWFLLLLFEFTIQGLLEFNLRKK